MTSRTGRLAAAAAVMLALAALPAAAQDGVRLVEAAADQDRAAVRALLDAGVDANAARADGVTALVYAAH